MPTHWVSVFLLLTFGHLNTAALAMATPTSSHLVTEVTNSNTGDPDPGMTFTQDGRGGGSSAVTSVTPAVEVTTPALPTSAVTTPRTTSRMTPRTTPRTTPPKTSPTTPHMASAFMKWYVDETPNRTGTFVVLFLLLVFLVICLYGAWRKLGEFGGSGSYSPCQIDKHLYANPEDGEGRDGQRKPVGQAFLASVCNLLPWKPGRPQGVELEEEEEEEEVEDEGGQSGVGGSEDESEGGRDEGSPTSGDEQSESDDYSSLGGLDLRERAVKAEGGKGEGREEEEDLSDPPSPRGGEELLSELQSFSGTATWTDTNHDVTVL